MTRFIISDTHFDHDNIIDYENRPFGSTHEMNQTLVNNWNSVVDDDDVVYHLGDIAFSSHDRIVSILDELNGTIVITKGNHDADNISEYEFSYPYVESCTLHRHGYRYYCSHRKDTIPQTWKHWKLVGHRHASSPFIDYQNKTINVSVENTAYYPIPLKCIDKCLKSMNNSSEVVKTIHESDIVNQKWYDNNIV